MESQYFHSVDGQELDESDINSAAENAALADDRVLAELLRILPYDGSAVAKGILPFHIAASPAAAPAAPLIGSSGSANAQVYVRPFRVIIGSRTAVGTDAKANWRDVRSAIVIGTTTLHQAITLGATSANHRWDLVYARVDTDQNQAGVTRYVKDPVTEAVAAQSISVRKATVVQLGVVQGSEGASPTRPALPADSAGTYYIPIAYIYVPHPFTASSTVNKGRIHEVAPCVTISEALGVPTIRPNNHAHKVGGTQLTAVDWPTGEPPRGYLPPSMVGGVSRIIPFGWSSGFETGHTLGGTTVIDDSIDWRNRAGKWIAHCSAGGVFAWNPDVSQDRVPSMNAGTGANAGVTRQYGVGQSMYDDGTTLCGLAGGVLCAVQPSNLSAMAGSSGVFLVARESDGALCAVVLATDPGVRLFIWLDASGQYNNATA